VRAAVHDVIAKHAVQIEQQQKLVPAFIFL
jgi:hypothetical protein